MGSSPVRFDVDAKALRAALREIGDAGLKKELSAANKSAAEVVADRALPSVPVRTGRLRQSVKALATQTSGSVKAGSAAVPYAAAIHFGRKTGGFIKARPFLWNAAEDAREQATGEYAQAIDRLLDKIR